MREFLMSGCIGANVRVCLNMHINQSLLGRRRKRAQIATSSLAMQDAMNARGTTHCAPPAAHTRMPRPCLPPNTFDASPQHCLTLLCSAGSRCYALLAPLHPNIA